MKTCEISHCSRDASSRMNGVHVCERCRIDFVTVGRGAVRFGGRWHGVKGEIYTKKQAELFPGLVTY